MMTNDVTLLDIENTGDKTVFRHGQECSDILNANAVDRDHSDENWNKDKTMKHVARIPEVVWLELEQMGIAGDAQAMRVWLEQFGQEYKTTRKKL